MHNDHRVPCCCNDRSCCKLSTAASTAAMNITQCCSTAPSASAMIIDSLLLKWQQYICHIRGACHGALQLRSLHRIGYLKYKTKPIKSALYQISIGGRLIGFLNCSHIVIHHLATNNFVASADIGPMNILNTRHGYICKNYVPVIAHGYTFKFVFVLGYFHSKKDFSLNRLKFMLIRVLNYM